MNRNQERAIAVRAVQSLARFEDPHGETIAPAVSIHETEDAFLVHADMPGASRETIVVRAEAGLLTLRSTLERRDSDGQAGRRRSYFRQFILTDGIDVESSTAVFEDGVLNIRLPKSEKGLKRDIPIR